MLQRRATWQLILYIRLKGGDLRGSYAKSTGGSLLRGRGKQSQEITGIGDEVKGRNIDCFLLSSGCRIVHYHFQHIEVVLGQHDNNEGHLSCSGGRSCPEGSRRGDFETRGSLPKVKADLCQGSCRPRA